MYERTEHSSTSTSTSTTTTATTLNEKVDNCEYTYDKAIENYKQFAENTTKRRTLSVTNISSISDSQKSKYDNDRWEKSRSASPVKGQSIEEKLSFFNQEMDRSHIRTVSDVKLRSKKEKSPKIDIVKRRSMFELRDSIEESEEAEKSSRRISFDSNGSLKSKVASFESLEVGDVKFKGITPPRDMKFKEKLQTFSQSNFENQQIGITPPRDLKFKEKLQTFSQNNFDNQQIIKKVPERDQGFHEKLASFTKIEKGLNETDRSKPTTPVVDCSLKNKILSFEELADLQKDNTEEFLKNSSSFVESRDFEVEKKFEGEVEVSN